MEPPSGLPPDRDRDRDKQATIRPQHSRGASAGSAAAAAALPQPQLHPQPPLHYHQQQQLVPVTVAHQLKSTLTLNLPQPQQLITHSAASPAPPQPTAAAVAKVAAGFSSASTSAAAAAAAAACGSSSKNAFSTATNTSSSAIPALASTATASWAATQAATAFSGSSVGAQLAQHHQSHLQQQQQHTAAPQSQSLLHHSTLAPNSSSASSSLLGGTSSGGASQQQQQTIEKLSRPMAFDKMESLVREMQDPEHGVPVRQQKMFLTSIPYAFMGYDLIEWLMDRLLVEESEALNIANQLCLHGYFFPVNDTKTLTVKDDSSLYRFQTPYYWPWQHKAPDNVEYAIYLAKRSLRNKQRHALEDYEAEALTSLHKNLKGKWDFISMQAEEQVRLAKERKKGDKIVGDSQERAYWRVHRPPPGQFTPLEPCPVPSRDRQGAKPNKKKTLEDMQREVDYLKKSLNRTRMKMSQACETLVNYSETFAEYDFFLQPVLPSNPWVTEDITFWQLNNTFVDIPTEKRVKRWAISIEELVSDPTGLQEFTAFLEKEYSHENIRFWIAVNRLRRSAHSQVVRKVNDIYEEFLKPGAPCEINIDGKTMESVLKGLKSPSRFTFDSASEHIYMLLLKKDCYPRFVRSDHYKRLLETGIQPSHKKRFFNFGGVSGAKKKMTAALSSQANLGGDMSSTAGMMKAGGGAMLSQAPPPGSLARRRGSDRSLTGSAHELAVIGVNKDVTTKVPHSHSQSNLSEMPYRETPKPKPSRLETTVEAAVCPWDVPDEPPTTQAPPPTTTQVKLSVCPWDQDNETKASPQRLTSTSSDNTDVSERLQRNLGIRHQNTVDSGEAGIKRLIPSFTEQRRASVSFTPSRLSEYQYGRPTSSSSKTSATPSPTVGSSQNVVDTAFPPLFTPLLHAQSAAAATIVATTTTSSTTSHITKDPPSSSDAEIEEELNKLSLLNSEPTSELAAPPALAQATPQQTPTPTPPPKTKITPPPPDNDNGAHEEVTPMARTDTDLRESPRLETLGVGDGDASSSEVNVSEVEAVVQEVQIELIIEATEFEGTKSPKPLTPTIQVQEPCMVAAGSLKSPVNLDANVTAAVVATDNAEPECGAMVDTEEQTKPALTPDSEVQTIIPTTDAITLPPIHRPAPPPPEIGPMEEEAQLAAQDQDDDDDDDDDDDEQLGAQEELSPTTDEYQEGMQFGGGDSKDDYDYDIVDTDGVQVGYIPPASTPAPSMAPLAEIDVDTVDDEPCDIEEPLQQQQAVESQPTEIPIASPTPPTDEVRKRRKKRHSDGRKMASLEEKEKASTSTGATAAAGAISTDAGAKTDDHNTVCPWEDENVSTSDGTFVKTYATLGYL